MVYLRVRDNYEKHVARFNNSLQVGNSKSFQQHFVNGFLRICWNLIWRLYRWLCLTTTKYSSIPCVATWLQYLKYSTFLPIIFLQLATVYLNVTSLILNTLWNQLHHFLTWKNFNRLSFGMMYSFIAVRFMLAKCWQTLNYGVVTKELFQILTY